MYTMSQNPPVETKSRNVRIDDDLWHEAQRIAADRRETLSAVIKAALVDYVLRNGGSLRSGTE